MLIAILLFIESILQLVLFKKHLKSDSVEQTLAVYCIIPLGKSRIFYYCTAFHQRENISITPPPPPPPDIKPTLHDHEVGKDTK